MRRQLSMANPRPLERRSHQRLILCILPLDVVAKSENENENENKNENGSDNKSANENGNDGSTLGRGARQPTQAVK